MYTPGSKLSSFLDHDSITKLTSSVTTGPLYNFAAYSHFDFETSAGLPYISYTSKLYVVNYIYLF